MRNESGITLIEMLTAVSIIIIMGGSSYAVFNTAIKAYNRTQSKLIQGQRARVALDKLVTDLSQIQTDTSDELLTIFSQDIPTSLGDRDIVSFVTLVRTDPDPFAAQLQGPNALLELPLSDVRRIVYYIGPKIPIAELDTGIVPPPITDSQPQNNSSASQDENLTLYRVVTTALDPELVVSSIMDSGTFPTVDENGTPIDFTPEPLIDGIINFDLKYMDAESEAMYDSWEQTDVIPIGVQVLVSVIDEDRQQNTTVDTPAQDLGIVGQGILTQSTMVYIPAGAVAAE